MDLKNERTWSYATFNVREWVQDRRKEIVRPNIARERTFPVVYPRQVTGSITLFPLDPRLVRDDGDFRT